MVDQQRRRHNDRAPMSEKGKEWLAACLFVIYGGTLVFIIHELFQWAGGKS